MTPEDRANLDQSQAALIDLYPPLWRGLYGSLLKEGFSEVDSMRLVQTYILSQCPNGVNGVDK